jgi:hypothetical protein
MNTSTNRSSSTGPRNARKLKARTKDSIKHRVDGLVDGRSSSGSRSKGGGKASAIVGITAASLSGVAALGFGGYYLWRQRERIMSFFRGFQDVGKGESSRMNVSNKPVLNTVSDASHQRDEDESTQSQAV